MGVSRSFDRDIMEPIQKPTFASHAHLLNNN